MSLSFSQRWAQELDKERDLFAIRMERKYYWAWQQAKAWEYGRPPRKVVPKVEIPYVVVTAQR